MSVQYPLIKTLPATGAKLASLMKAKIKENQYFPLQSQGEILRFEAVRVIISNKTLKKIRIALRCNASDMIEKETKTHGQSNPQYNRKFYMGDCR